MDLEFTPSMIVEGGIDFISACLEPDVAVTSPIAHSAAHGQGKTRNTPTKGVQTSSMSLDLEALANCFSLESVERYLNCVTLPVDPRSPNTRAQGLTFSFSNFRDEDGNVVAESRQDSSPPGKHHFSEREATELSFMAEREAVMNGDRMTDEDDDEDVGNNLFQQWQRTGWSSNAFVSTPKASNHFHWPTILSPTAAGDCASSTVELNVKGSDTGDMPAVMTSMDVPGGLWSLPSNDASDGNEEEEEDKEDEEDEVEGEKGYEDHVMMMRSPKNESDSKAECQWNNVHVIDKGPKDDLLWHLKMKLQDINPKSANNDPMLAAQLAITQADHNSNYYSQGNKELTDEEIDDEVQEGLSNESDGHYFQPDSRANSSLGLIDEEQRREAVESSSAAAAGWQEAAAFHLDGGNDEEDEYGCYYPNSNNGACPLLLVNVEQEKKVSEEHTPPRLAHELTTADPKQYVNEEEANRHFDDIFSSFELSLNRHTMSDHQSPKIHVRDIESQRPSSKRLNRAKLSPLTAAAHKMKSRGTHKDTLQDEQHDAHQDNYSSSSSTFLEGTLMGCKLNHRPTPPTSPAPSDTSKHLASSNGIASESIIDHANKTIFQAKVSLESMERATHKEMKNSRVAADIINYNLDEINFEELGHQDEQLQEGGMKRVTKVDEDCPDDEKIGMAQESCELSPKADWMGMQDVGNDGFKDSGDDDVLDKMSDTSSFDSTVNWDALHYSMSDNMAMSINSQSVVNSPTFKTTNNRSVVRTIKKVDGDAECSTATNLNRPSMSPRPSVLNCVENENVEATVNSNNAHSGLQKQKQDTNDDKSSTYEHRPITSTDMISYLRKKKQVHPLSPKHGNDAWDSIEQIKRCHDEEICNIRMIAEDIIKASSSPIVTTSTSPKENVAPLLPYTSNGTTHHLKQVIKSIKKHDVQGGQCEQMKPITPRSFDAKMQLEVQSRIDAIREQHKKNMDKIRDALDDINDDSVRYEGGHCRHDHATTTVVDNNPSDVSKDAAHIAQCVGVWKSNANKFDKAKERYSSWKTNISTPTHDGERLIRSHFKFDDSSMDKDTHSPRVKELMVENEELEKEMRKIRLLSPKQSTVKEASLSYSGTNDSLQSSPHHLYTPSSARYTTPRLSSHHLRTPSSARYTTPRSSTGALYQPPHVQTIHTILSEDSEQEFESGTPTRLIADVKRYLEESNTVHEHLLEPF